MDKDKYLSFLCKSVFKSGENTISKEQFTQAMAELINKLEKRKLP